MAVSKELGKYRPLTIWQIIGFMWNQLWPWVWIIIGISALSHVIAAFYSQNYLDGAVAIPAILFSLLGSILGFRNRAEKQNGS